MVSEFSPGSPGVDLPPLRAGVREFEVRAALVGLGFCEVLSFFLFCGPAGGVAASELIRLEIDFFKALCWIFACPGS